MSNPQSTETIEYVHDCRLFFYGEYLCMDMTFEGPSGHQGIGPRTLIRLTENNYNHTSTWFSKLKEIFDLPDEVNFLPLIKGKFCRVIRDDGYFISGIGHPAYKDKDLIFKRDLMR